MASLSITVCTKCSSFSTANLQPFMSPVATLLGSNYAPSTSEAAIIQSTISRLNTDISLVESEIGRVQAALDLLLNARNNIQATLAEHKALLSPVRRLPPELISHIFLHCVSESDGTLQRVGQMHWTFSQICLGWRMVALSTPQLWSSIDVNLTRENVPSQTAKLATCLSRSRMNPISFSLSSDGLDFDVDSICDLLINACERWQDIQISFSPHLIHSALTSMRGCLPLLRTLDLSLVDAEPIPLDCFNVAPMLRSMQLCDPWPALTMTLPWIQLETLLLQDHEWDQCVEIMRLCPNLVDCTLVDVGIFGDIPGAPLSFLGIFSLQLSSIQYKDTLYLPDFLVLPALRKLVLDLDPPQEEFAPFISSFSSTLENLILFDTSITEDTLIKCLEALSSLERLQVLSRYYPTPIGDKLLNRLTPMTTGSRQHSCLTPNLQVFIYSDDRDSTTTFPFAALVGMVQSRWRPNVTVGDNSDIACFKSLIINVVGHATSEDAARLERCRREGLEVIITESLM